MAPRNPRKKPPPSRLRYEANNPVVSVRVPKDLYDALLKFKKTRGLSMADVLKLGLGLAEPGLEKAWEDGSIFGYDLGYEIARDEYEVSYWCGRCRRRHLSVTTDDEKEAAAAMMYKAGWHDPDCQSR